MERAKKIEERGGSVQERTPVFLIIDEFQLLQKLEILETIISEARKYGLYLILSHQNTAQISNGYNQTNIGLKPSKVVCVVVLLFSVIIRLI